jgi:hypothetical protein
MPAVLTELPELCTAVSWQQVGARNTTAAAQKASRSWWRTRRHAEIPTAQVSARVQGKRGARQRMPLGLPDW